MRLRTTLFLAGTLVMLSLAYYFLELKEAQEEAKTTLSSFEEKEVTAISIRRGKKVITLTKREGEWRMSQPVEDRGDEKEITALLGNVIRAKIERTLEATDENMSDFGLQDPAIVLTVHLKEKEQPFILELGSPTPAGFSVYARRQGEEKVLLAPATVKTSLEKPPFAFRSKVPLFFDQKAVKAVSLHTDSLRVRLERHQEEKWRITEPIQGKADAGKVLDLLRSLTKDHIRAFLDKPPASLKKVGLDPPRGEIRLTLEGGAEAGLLLGSRKKAGGVYARRRGDERVLELEEDFLQALPKQVADLRDRTLLALDREKVQQIELKSPHGQTLLRKVEGRWRIEQPEEALADQQLIEDLLWDLDGARVKEFVADNAKSLKPYGLDAPAVTIRLLDQEEKPLTTLALNRAKKKEGAYARIGDSQAIFLVEARLYEQFLKGPFDLRFRRLLSFEPWDVGQMKLSRDGQEIIVEKRKEEWALKKPKEGKARYSVVMDILNEIKDLKWQKIIAEAAEDLDPYGLNSPVATVGLTQADGKPIGTLLLGKEEGNLVYAKLHDKPQVYGIRSGFLQLLPRDAAALAE